MPGAHFPIVPNMAITAAIPVIKSRQFAAARSRFGEFTVTSQTIPAMGIAKIKAGGLGDWKIVRARWQQVLAEQPRLL